MTAGSSIHPFTVNGSSITKVHLLQVAEVTNDGVGWDNLSFSTIPEPSTFALYLLTAADLAVARRRRKRAA